MPGACAYLTLVNLIREPARLESYGLNPEAIISILDYFRFCEPGAVSPDYPYLDILHHDAAPWGRSDALRKNRRHDQGGG
jgi:hypothetical protein